MTKSIVRRGGVHETVFLIPGIQAIHPKVTAGTADPTVGPGVLAPEGSIYLRYVAGAGEIWIKTGAADTAWGLPAIGIFTGAILQWGNYDIGSAVDTRYLSPGFDQDTASLASLAGYRSPRSGTLKNFRVRHNQPNGNGSNVMYDLNVNGTPQNLSLTLASGAVGDVSDLVSAVSVSAGDLLEVTATKDAPASVGTVGSTFSCELS